MSSFNSEKPRRFPVFTVLLLIIIAVLAGGAYYLAPRFERDAPQIRITPETDVLGVAPLEIVIGDQGAGLKSVTATLSAGGTEHNAASRSSTPSRLSEKKFTVASSKLAGLKEGPAVLRVSARDGSLWNFFKGNETVIQKNLTIDVTPPTLELIADDRYVNFGGVGAIVYKPSADTDDERREDRRLLLSGLQGTDKGPAGSLLRALRPSLQRAGGRQGRARRHRQGRQFAARWRSSTS